VPTWNLRSTKDCIFK